MDAFVTPLILKFTEPAPEPVLSAPISALEGLVTDEAAPPKSALTRLEPSGKLMLPAEPTTRSLVMVMSPSLSTFT